MPTAEYLGVRKVGTKVEQMAVSMVENSVEDLAMQSAAQKVASSVAPKDSSTVEQLD